jgi:predicted transposase YbfD/YdcC
MAFLIFQDCKLLIRVQSERHLHRANIIEVSSETRYYVASFRETAQAFANRIRGYWGSKTRCIMFVDVTQGEDASRIRTSPLVQSWAIARNFALNLYRSNRFQNMAQAQRFAGFGLNILK